MSDTDSTEAGAFSELLHKIGLAAPSPTAGFHLTDAEWGTVDELLRDMMAAEQVSDITPKVEAMQAFLSKFARRPTGS